MLLDLIFPKRCFTCHRPNFYLCPACRQNFTPLAVKHRPLSSFEGVLSCFRYHGSLRSAIISLKFDFVTDLAGELSDIISHQIQTYYPNLLSYWHENQFVLTPIPLHTFRQNWRGFNQSEIIFRRVANNLKIPFKSRIILRHRFTLAQSQITDKALRLRNTASAFKLINHRYHHLILADDVFTTGSTLNSAAAVFPKNTHLWALTLAG